jgi:hypothetical protein
MNSLSAFQLVKHSARTNEIARIHETPIVSYGRVIEVIDARTVIVEAAVKSSLAVEMYTVPLLTLSSASIELNIQPQAGDKVLLLFLQKYSSGMFDADETIENPNAAGYNSSSVVGMLLSTFKGFADTIVQFYKDGEDYAADLTSNAKWNATFNSGVGLIFCRAVFDSEDEQLISMLFGEGRPFLQQFLSKVTREHGFWKDNDDKLIELDAGVIERYSEFAPITKDIQGSQSISIGIDDEGNDTEAPVDITLGAKADITVKSKSGKTEEYEKDVILKSDSAISIKNSGDLSVKSDGAISVKSDHVSIEASTTVEIKNASESAGRLLGELIDEIINTVNTAVIGTPTGSGSITIVPANLLALKTRFSSLLK